MNNICVKKGKISLTKDLKEFMILPIGFLDGWIYFFETRRRVTT